VRFAIVLGFALLFFSTIALGGPPLDGTYKSTDLGGPVYMGHYTEAWIDSGGALNLGTTLNNESWDGNQLGTQWKYWCASIQTPPSLIYSTIDSLTGDGTAVYEKHFSGGFLWLSGTGPWANGDPDYPGVIDSYIEIETIQYVNWKRVHAVTNVDAQGHFDNYPSTCMTFSVGNGVEIGSTDFGQMKPSTYPDFLQEGTCAPVMQLGGWWDFTQLSLVIHGCQVPSKKASWGAIKAIYQD